MKFFNILVLVIYVDLVLALNKHKNRITAKHKDDETMMDLSTAESQLLKSGKEGNEVGRLRRGRFLFSNLSRRLFGGGRQMQHEARASRRHDNDYRDMKSIDDELDKQFGSRRPSEVRRVRDEVGRRKMLSRRGSESLREEVRDAKRVERRRRRRRRKVMRRNKVKESGKGESVDFSQMTLTQLQNWMAAHAQHRDSHKLLQQHSDNDQHNDSDSDQPNDSDQANEQRNDEENDVVNDDDPLFKGSAAPSSRIPTATTSGSTTSTTSTTTTSTRTTTTSTVWDEKTTSMELVESSTEWQATRRPRLPASTRSRRTASESPTTSATAVEPAASRENFNRLLENLGLPHLADTLKNEDTQVAMLDYNLTPKDNFVPSTPMDRLDSFSPEDSEDNYNYIRIQFGQDEDLDHNNQMTQFDYKPFIVHANHRYPSYRKKQKKKLVDDRIQISSTPSTSRPRRTKWPRPFTVKAGRSTSTRRPTSTKSSSWTSTSSSSSSSLYNDHVFLSDHDVELKKNLDPGPVLHQQTPEAADAEEVEDFFKGKHVVGTSFEVEARPGHLTTRSRSKSSASKTSKSMAMVKIERPSLHFAGQHDDRPPIYEAQTSDSLFEIRSRPKYLSNPFGTSDFIRLLEVDPERFRHNATLGARHIPMHMAPHRVVVNGRRPQGGKMTRPLGSIRIKPRAEATPRIDQQSRRLRTRRRRLGQRLPSFVKGIQKLPNMVDRLMRRVEGSFDEAKMT